MLPRLRPGCAEETEASPTGGNAICATSGALRSAGGTRLPMAGRVTAHQASVAEQATTSAISCRSHGRREPGAAASRCCRCRPCCASWRPLSAECVGLYVEGSSHLVGGCHGDRAAVHGDQEEVVDLGRRGRFGGTAALAASAAGRAPADPVRVGGRAASTTDRRERGAPAAGDVADDAAGWCGVALVEVGVAVETDGHGVL